MIARRELRNRFLLVAAAVLFTLVAMEFGCRLLRGPWFLVHWPNLVLLEAEQHKKPCMFIHDDTLGYVPEPDCKGPEHSHDAQGLRAMPAPPADTAVQGGDYLIVMGRPNNLRALETLLAGSGTTRS